MFSPIQYLAAIAKYQSNVLGRLRLMLCLRCCWLKILGSVSTTLICPNLAFSIYFGHDRYLSIQKSLFPKLFLVLGYLGNIFVRVCAQSRTAYLWVNAA